MSKADKMQRHRAKREAKRRDARRRDGISPLKRLADAPGELECWMSRDIEEFGQCTIFVYKRGGGLKGVACFLVDQGVVGLKDAWHRINLEHSEFEEMLEATRSHDIPIGRASIDQVRAMVAGGARWAHDNGMRLPKEWAKTATLIGGVSDWQHADVSNFKMEFAGQPEDLRQRLIGEPFESYIERPDITFIFSEDAPILDLETGEYLNTDDESDWEDEDDDIPEEMVAVLQHFSATAQELADKASRWLLARHEKPSPELAEAALNIIVGNVLAQANAPRGTSAEQIARTSIEFIDKLGERIEEARVAGYDAAMEQFFDFLEFDPQVLREAITPPPDSQTWLGSSAV